MPIISDFSLPKTASDLDLPKDFSAAPFFIAFIASKSPTTGQSWCPDVRAALPVIEATFLANDAPKLAIVEVGQQPE